MKISGGAIAKVAGPGSPVATGPTAPAPTLWPEFAAALSAAQGPQNASPPTPVLVSNQAKLEDIAVPPRPKDDGSVALAQKALAISFSAISDSERRAAQREGRPARASAVSWLELAERVLESQLQISRSKSAPKERRNFAKALISEVVRQALLEVPADRFVERFHAQAELLFEAKSQPAKKRLGEWVKRGERQSAIEEGLEKLEEARSQGLSLSPMERKLVVAASRRAKKDPEGALQSLKPFFKRAEAFFENPVGKAAWPNLSTAELAALRREAKRSSETTVPVAKQALGEARLALLVAEVEGVPPPTTKERLEGIMLALAVGDALGGPTEFMSREALRQTHGLVTDYVGGGWLDLAPGEFTDDTQMAVAIARSIVDQKGFDAADIQKRFVKWLSSDPKDVGNLTRRALELARAGAGPELAGLLPWALGGYENAGNGSVMRLGPVAILTAFQDLEVIEKTAMASSAMTHADPRCTYGSAAVAFAVSRLVAQSDDVLAEVIDYLAPRCPELREALEKVPTLELEDLRTSGYVVDTVQAAFWALHHARSLPDGLVRVSNLGEDTDTAGATAGILLGAKYGVRGIPEDWLHGLQKRSELQELATQLAELATSTSKAPS